MNHLIDILQLSPEEIMELVNTACDIIDHPAAYAHKCDGKILATLFFEPSTRTRLSFESAMLSLGGQVLGFSSANSSSAAKGESVSDTIRTVSCYSDIIAMRHPKEGAPLVASRHSLVPIINAGDGGHKEQYIKSKNIPYIQSTSLDEVMPELDILYMTRVQRERFFNEEDYLRLKDSYILTPEKLKNAKPDLRILHPLPRVNEISVAVDEDPRACYFQQVQYGKYIRMALILKLLNIA